MKYVSYILAAVAALVTSCSVKEAVFQTPAPDDSVFHATLEKPEEADTKVYVNDELLLRWHEDDRVSIFNGNTSNQQYRFDGQTGDNAGDFSIEPGQDAATGTAIPHVVAVYPYRESTQITGSEVLTVMLPAEQSYAKNSFGPSSVTMVSVTSDNVLNFKSVGGYLKIRLYGEGFQVRSITLKGNNGEKLSGKATVTMPLDGTPSIEMAEDAGTEITLTCEDPVILGATADQSTEFWFVIPPVDFEQGFVVTVRLLDGFFEKKTSKHLTFDRNRLYKMSPFGITEDAVFQPVPETIDLGLSVQWASFNLGADRPEDFGGFYSWGETDPKQTFQWDNYAWSEGTASSLTKYCWDPESGLNGFTDWKIRLDPEDDPAHVALGDAWRLPTKEELVELRENCTWEWTTVNGIAGNKVTGPNGNSIFIPAAGCKQDDKDPKAGTHGVIWSSSLADYSSAMVYNLGFDEGVTYFNDRGLRYHGHSIRPVFGPSPVIPVEGISLDKEELVLDPGDSETLHATILPEQASYTQVVWSSSDERVATVSADGEVQGVVPGTAVILARGRDGGVTASCTVTVRSLFAVPDAVDLGLSVKWATFNLGAAAPEECGNYYAWGEMTTKAVYNWSTYQHGSSTTKLTKYNLKPECGIVDGKDTLDPEDDAAYRNLGTAWRMPTSTEVDELIENCTWTEVEQNGMNGYLITSDKEGYTDRSIFLPKAGCWIDSGVRNVGTRICYWSSSRNSEGMDRAHYISNYYSNTVMNDPGASRTHGLTIRPVSAE